MRAHRWFVHLPCHTIVEVDGADMHSDMVMENCAACGARHGADAMLVWTAPLPAREEARAELRPPSQPSRVCFPRVLAATPLLRSSSTATVSTVRTGGRTPLFAAARAAGVPEEEAGDELDTVVDTEAAFTWEWGDDDGGDGAGAGCESPVSSLVWFDKEDEEGADRWYARAHARMEPSPMRGGEEAWGAAAHE